MVFSADPAFGFDQTWVSLAFLVWIAICGVVSGLMLPGERKLAAGDLEAEKKVGPRRPDRHRAPPRDALPDDLEARRLMDDAELVRPLSGVGLVERPGLGRGAGVPGDRRPSGARGQRFAGGPPSVVVPLRRGAWAPRGTSSCRARGRGAGRGDAGQGRPRPAGPDHQPPAHPAGRAATSSASRRTPSSPRSWPWPTCEALQGGGVAACVKHLVANDQEDDRFEISSEPDERTLREVSLLPVRARAPRRRRVVDDGRVQPPARHPLLSRTSAAHRPSCATSGAGTAS